MLARDSTGELIIPAIGVVPTSYSIFIALQNILLHSF
jgi:hypothetical protein